MDESRPMAFTPFQSGAQARGVHALALRARTARPASSLTPWAGHGGLHIFRLRLILGLWATPGDSASGAA
jgi:hypothetical protein